MKPIGKNVVIQTVEEEIKTSSGILLSSEDANQLRYKKGLVIQPGSEVTVINAGEHIYYDKRAGYTMIINNQTYTIIQENDIVLVL
jgi:co-chaperonin GroES (HSP10)